MQILLGTMCGLALVSAVANVATLAPCTIELISCIYFVTKLSHSSIVVIHANIMSIVIYSTISQDIHGCHMATSDSL